MSFQNLCFIFLLICSCKTAPKNLRKEATPTPTNLVQTSQIIKDLVIDPENFPPGIMKIVSCKNRQVVRVMAEPDSRAASLQLKICNGDNCRTSSFVGQSSYIYESQKAKVDLSVSNCVPEAYSTNSSKVCGPESSPFELSLTAPGADLLLHLNIANENYNKIQQVCERMFERMNEFINSASDNFELANMVHQYMTTNDVFGCQASFVNGGTNNLDLFSKLLATLQKSQEAGETDPLKQDAVQRYRKLWDSTAILFIGFGALGASVGLNKGYHNFKQIKEFGSPALQREIETLEKKIGYLERVASEGSLQALKAEQAGLKKLLASAEVGEGTFDMKRFSKEYEKIRDFIYKNCNTDCLRQATFLPDSPLSIKFKDNIHVMQLGDELKTLQLNISSFIADGSKDLDPIRASKNLAEFQERLKNLKRFIGQPPASGGVGSWLKSWVVTPVPIDLPDPENLGKLLGYAVDSKGDAAGIGAQMRDRASTLDAEIKTLEEKMASLKQQDGFLDKWIGSWAEDLKARLPMARPEITRREFLRKVEEKGKMAGKTVAEAVKDELVSLDNELGKQSKLRATTTLDALWHNRNWILFGVVSTGAAIAGAVTYGYNLATTPDAQFLEDFPKLFNDAQTYSQNFHTEEAAIEAQCQFASLEP